MLILAFDTSAARCACALWRDGDVLAARSEAMTQGHAEALVPLINGMMIDARIDYAALDRIAVTVGPGSFTGVRVAVATARAMGLSLDRPVVGVTTTEALAAAVADGNTSRRILAAIDSKRGDVYAQLFDGSGMALNEAAVVAPALLPDFAGPGPVVVVGDGAAIAAGALMAQAAAVHDDALPEPAVIARLAAARTPAGAPLPMYLRPPDATLPKDGGRLRP